MEVFEDAGGLASMGVLDHDLPPGLHLAAGDFDGDGYKDLAVGPGSEGGGIRIHPGSAQGLSTDSAQVLEPESTSASFSVAPVLGAAVADLDADGIDDLLMAADAALDSGFSPEAGRVLWFLGGPEGLGEVADGELGATTDLERYGWRILPGVDLDGDGYDEVVVGSAGFDPGSYSTAPPVVSSYVDVLWGGPAGPSPLTSVRIWPSWLLRSALSGSHGALLPRIGDLDGDGDPELGLIGRSAWNHASGLGRLELHRICPEGCAESD